MIIGCSSPSASWKRQFMLSEYLVPSLKMWPTSMPRFSIMLFAALRARVAGRGEPDVDDRRGLEVAAGHDPDQVGVGRVGAGRRRRQTHDGGVGEDPDAGQAHRARKALGAAGDLLDLRLGGELQVGAAERVLELDLVDLEIAADQDRRELLVGLEDQGLDQVGGSDAEERGDFVDTAHLGGVDGLRLLGRLSSGHGGASATGPASAFSTLAP